MFKHNVWKTLQKSIILVLVFLLAMEPVLVAASPQLHEPRQKEIETFASRHITQVNTGEISFHMLFQNADVTFKGILNGLKLTNAFEVVVDLVKVVSTYITTTIHSLNDAIQVLQDILSGGLRLWDDFTTLVKRVGATRLISWGVNDSTFLVGHILRLLGTSVSLSDEALTALKSVTDDLVAAGVDLSDDAAQGLGKMAKSMERDQFQRLVNAVGNTCDVGMINHASKRTRITKATFSGSGTCLPATIFTSYKNFDDETLTALKKMAERVEFNDFTELLAKYATDPDNLDRAKYIFNVLGNPAVSTNAVKKATEQGPEAAEAFSLWAKDFPDGPILANGQPILENENVAKALALRAANDAKAIKILREWNGAIDNLDIEGLAVNSTVGNNMLFGLGAGPINELNSPYVDGWVQFSISRNANFYITNPEVSDLVKKLVPNKTQQDAVFWSINEAALIRDGGPIATRSNFIYQIATNNDKDVEVMIAVWSNASDTQIKNILGITDPQKDVPFRVKELRLLFDNHYRFEEQLDGNVLLYFKP
jgi:hypothetical protein